MINTINNNYKVNKGYITQVLDDKITIFDGDNSVLYTLNETGSYIFRKLKSGKQVPEIVSSLVKHFGITTKRAEKDVNDLISDLISKKIIVQKK